MSETVGVIRDFIRQQANVSTTDDLFSDDVDLLDYGYLDSFGIVGLIEMINGRYGVDLSNVDFYQPGHRTIAGIAAITDERVKSKGA